MNNNEQAMVEVLSMLRTGLSCIQMAEQVVYKTNDKKLQQKVGKLHGAIEKVMLTVWDEVSKLNIEG